MQDHSQQLNGKVLKRKHADRSIERCHIYSKQHKKRQEADHPSNRIVSDVSPFIFPAEEPEKYRNLCSAGKYIYNRTGNDVWHYQNVSP